MKLYSNRAGILKYEKTGYYCYVPTPLSKITINYDQELIDLLSEANRLIGKLDGIATNLPDQDIFISKYVEKEAVVSSQIEGTQASLTDVFQINKIKNDKRKEVDEIVNYVYALKYGIKLLDKLPISIRYIKEIHKQLLKDVRGELRNSQNWIGPNGCNLSNAIFVPPSVDEMKIALFDLENYMNNESLMDQLLKIGLIHYQFETIHPFLDGNGRLGRLIIPLWLIEHNFLKYPLLYLSLYFNQNQIEYYGLLMDVRFKGKYEEWLKFFLKGIIEISIDSISTIEKISKLVFDNNKKIESITYKNKELLLKVMSYIYKHPYFDSNDLINEFKISKPTSSSVIKKLLEMGIISPTSNKQRYVIYKFTKYVSILE